MGLIGNIKEFFDSRSERRVAKNIKTIQNPKAIKEDRGAAIEYFKDFKEPEIAVNALLKRFEYSLEHGINDTREKELAMEGVIKHAEKSIPFIAQHLRTTSRIAWPIKALQTVAKEDQVVEILKGLLNFGDISFDRDAVDKNYDVLCYLRDFKLPGFAAKLATFLQDPDERVRFAAVEVLIEQDDPEVPSLIESFLADESSENRRIRRAVIDSFVKNGWTLANPGRFENGQVEAGVLVNKKGMLEARA